MRVSSMLVLLNCLKRTASLRFAARHVKKQTMTTMRSHVAFETFFKALPKTSTTALTGAGYKGVAPVQEATWEAAGDEAAHRGAAFGESLAIHAPTGSGKTLAMILPALAGTIWSGRENSKVLILVPTRELAQQHEALVRLVLPDESVKSVTTSSVGNDLEGVALEMEEARVIIATPAELAQVLEFDPDLYGDRFASRCEAVVLDELDLLMPARKYAGGRFSRWQERGFHPAEAIVKLVCKRTSTLQVIAGSATLDSASKKKLEKLLKSSRTLEAKLPLRTVTLSAATTLVTKAKFSEASVATTRATIVPRAIQHRSLALSNKSDKKAMLTALRFAVKERRPRAAIVLACSSSGLKIRQVTDHLDKLGGFELGDVLWPDASRARRKPQHNGNNKAAKAQPLMDAAGREELQRQQTATLNEMIRVATREKPCIAVADQAVARGLHLDDLDSVFILGRPSNADSYLHMAGRTGRCPFPDDDAAVDDIEPTVLTIGTNKDLDQLKSSLRGVSAAFEITPSDIKFGVENQTMLPDEAAPAPRRQRAADPRRVLAEAVKEAQAAVQSPASSPPFVRVKTSLRKKMAADAAANAAEAASSSSD